MQIRSAFAVVVAVLGFTACGDDDSGCPEGPQAPLGSSCGDEGLTCRYGYIVPQCGGRTVICRDRRWQELEHTDPQPSCFDGGFTPDGAVDAHVPPLDAARDAQSDASEKTDASDASALCVPVALGGGCSYVRTEGTATVTALETPASGSYSCMNQPVVVRFTFAPDEPARAACFGEYEEPSWFTFRLPSGANPPRACIDAANLRVGSTLRVTRQDIANGTCTPVVFVFPTSPGDACQSVCRL